MKDSTSKYWPRQIDEIEGNGVSLINEPIREVIPMRPVQRSLHAVIAENLAAAEHLLVRLQNGVLAADSDRATIRELWLATKKQREILAAAVRLELE